MKKKIYLIAMATAALTMGSCSQDEVLNMNIDQPAGPAAIEFGAYTGKAVETKGSVANLETLKATDYAGLGVFAYKSESEIENTEFTWASDFMNNQLVKWNTTVSPAAWTYSPIKYWPEDYVSFVAYAPYADNNTYNQISHTVAADGQKTTQVDLLVSEVVYDQQASTNSTTAGQVKFTMKHVLSKIGWSVVTAKDYSEKGNGQDATAKTTITLTSITLGDVTGEDGSKTGTGFYESGSYNAVAGAWNTGDNAPSGKQNFSWTLSAGNTLSHETNAAVTNGTDFLFVIPQKFTGENITALPIKVGYTVTTVDSKFGSGEAAKSEISYTYSGSIAKDFEQGKAYTIAITVSLNEVTFDVDESFTGWDDAAYDESGNPDGKEEVAVPEKPATGA